jgi:RND family efflux transporter MFP subunit
MQRSLAHLEKPTLHVLQRARRAAKSQRPLVATAVAILVAGAATWWWFGRGLEVTAVTPTRGTAVEIVYATGAVEPIRWAKVASIIRDRIVEICDCEGKSVKKGEVLARLEDKEQRAQLRELDARAAYARQETERQSKLVERGFASTQKHEQVSMDLRALEALIMVQKEKLADYTIAAPIDGVVLRRDGEVGEIAEAGQILFRIGALKPLQVVAEVNEEDVARVNVGQTVLLRTDAFLDQRLEGTVREITPMGDPIAKTFRIKVALPDDTPLKPGMSLEANVITREKDNVLLIPADAVQGDTVYVLDGNKVEKRKIKIGIRGTSAVEVLAGLTENDRVVSPAIAGIQDGKRVRVADKPEASL